MLVLGLQTQVIVLSCVQVLGMNSSPHAGVAEYTDLLNYRAILLLIVLYPFYV